LEGGCAFQNDPNVDIYCHFTAYRPGE
jgi:hypothetical protein